MTTTHHSEYLPLNKVYLKSVKTAFISDLNLAEQWRKLNYLSRPDFDTSVDEYEVFEQVFLGHGIETKYFPVNDNVGIDSV